MRRRRSVALRVVTVRTTAVVAVAVLVAACRPVAGLPDGWSGTYLTRDQGDTMTFTLGTSDGAPTLGVTAATTNRGSNTRLVTGLDAAPVSTDHGMCAEATVSRWSVQEGVAVRDRLVEGRHQVITVTKNVFAAATNYYHVHLWDSRTPDTALQVGSFDMSAALGPRGAAIAGPRRLCVRVAGAQLVLKVWASGMAEPAWTDPVHVRSIDLPAAWVYPGRPALYAGHVAAGERLTYAAIAPVPVTPAPSPSASTPTTVPSPRG